ncbi:MAG: MGDG synthase family glycosyltransferase [Bacilli bacterium]
MKIVVFTCSTGGGHNACAKYIKEEFNLNGIECDIKDYFELVGDKASNVAEKLYLDSTKGKGSIFGGVYKLGELYSKTNIPSPVYGLNMLVKEKLKKYLKENNYTLAIGTHLFPCLALTKLKKEENINFINVATDYECIPFWEETNPNEFVIPSILLKDTFLKKGFKEETILPIGIPISSKFINTTGCADLPKDKEIILIASGSMGFGNIKEIVLNLLAQMNNVYVLVVCGNNEVLKNELKAITNPNLIVYGFVNNMNELIKSSTIVVTKPGGLTTTEVAVMNKPLIHINPIPGVEDYNATFFASNFMSIRVNNINNLVGEITRLMNDKNLQNLMIENQKKYINKNSAADLVKYIIDKYGSETL